MQAPAPRGTPPIAGPFQSESSRPAHLIPCEWKPLRKQIRNRRKRDTMSTPDDMRLHHPPSQYMTRSRYVQSPRYLPLWEADFETEIENQESLNEESMLSEPVIPALEGFPDAKEFDQLIQR